MGKHSLKLLFLRKYRTSKKYYRQLRLPSAIDGETISFGGSSRSKSNTSVGNGYQTPSHGGGGGGGGRRRPTGYVNNSAPVDTVDCCVLLYDCLSHCRLRTFLVITVIGIVSTAGLYFHNQSLLQYRLNNTNTSSTFNDNPFSTTPSIKINTTTNTTSSSALNKLLDYYAHQHVSINNQDDDDDDNVPYLNRVYREDVFSPQHGIRLKRCTIPVLKPLSPEVKPFIGYSNKPNCVREQQNSFNDEIPFSIQNASWLVRNPKVDQSKLKGCCYRPFHRNGDNNIW